MALWGRIESEDSLRGLLESSTEKPILILKHSFRCALSGMAKHRIEKQVDARIQYHLVDVINDRAVSNLLADWFSVHHESPQAFFILDSRLIEVKSHMAIKPQGFSLLLDSFADEKAKF